MKFNVWNWDLKCIKLKKKTVILLINLHFEQAVETGHMDELIVMENDNSY